MNLKNNKGYVGTDISIAVLILLILVPTIMGIVFNINRSQYSADIKAAALNIAVNALEASKGIEVSELTADEIIAILSGDAYNWQIQETQLAEDETSTKDQVTDEELETFSAVAVITDKASYKLKIKVTDYKKENSEAIEGIVKGIVKTVKATVIYKVGNEKQSIDLSTVVK